jgi:hypothetical protein
MSYLMGTSNPNPVALSSLKVGSAPAITALAPSASVDTTNAFNITSGTLPGAQLSGSYSGISGLGTVTQGVWQGTPLTSSYLPAGILFATQANAYTAAQSGTPATLAISGSTFTPVFANAQNFNITLVHASCPCVVANPATPPVGTSGYFWITQSATGSDLVGTWGSFYKGAGGSLPTLSTGANAQDLLWYVVVSATQIVVGTGALNAH